MLPRRKISELKARFELEPTLDDVFVEGDRDKRLIDIAHTDRGRSRPVYPVSYIEIPFEILDSYGLTDGNRQRVIALCKVLSLPIGASACYLIDRDLDWHLNRELVFPRLSYTIHSDIEGAFLSSEILKEIVVNAGRAKVGNWQDLFDSIEGVVKAVFCVRLALEELELRVSLPDITKSIYKSSDKIIFDINDFVDKFASRGIGQDYIQKLKEMQTTWCETVSDKAARMAGNGHDYLQIVSWVIKKFGGSSKIADSLDDILALLVPRVADDILMPLS